MSKMARNEKMNLLKVKTCETVSVGVLSKRVGQSAAILRGSNRR